MTSQQILQSDLLDILFEKRNKLYGAYLLRKNYRTQLLKAIGITSVAVLLLTFIVPSSAGIKTATADKDSLIVSIVHLPETKKPEPPPKPQPIVQQVKTEVYIDKIKITDHANPIATQKDLSNVAIGDTKIAGSIDPGIPSLPQEPVLPGSGKDNPTLEKEKDLITRQPQFPGGIAAWQKFLSTNLHSPQDLEAGEKKTVVIKFHVDVDGMVTNFQVVQSGGEAFDNEVIRVLKKMPRWMPALQAGQPIAVPFSQPVTFVSFEE